MLSQGGPECAGGYEYAQSLLRDRYRELQALEIRHHSEQIPTDEYVSCRRALFQAISELSHIERDNPERDPAFQTNCDDLNDQTHVPDREPSK